MYITPSVGEMYIRPSVGDFCLMTFVPFQVALVTWTESVGLTLLKRDLNSMQLRTPSGSVVTYHILHIFPFTSETKRMGIIVKVSLTLPLPSSLHYVLLLSY